MAANKYQRGSTTEKTLACRMSKHRDMHRRYLAGTHNRVTSFDILQYPDAQIILVENYPCQSKDELLARERYHIEMTPNCVNRQIPGRTPAEYYQANKEVLRRKASQQHDCPCSGNYAQSDKARHEKSKKHQAYLKEQAKNDNEWLNNFVEQELACINIVS